MQPPAPDAALHASEAEPTDIEADLELHVERQRQLVARIRELQTQLAVAEAEAAAASRRADAASAALARLRGRRLVRWADRITRLPGRARWSGGGGAAASAAAAEAPPAPADPAAAANDPVHRPIDPATWRAAALARVAAGPTTHVLGPDAGEIAAALTAVGWSARAVDDVRQGLADVLVLTDPAVDSHPAPEATIRVGWIRGAVDGWLGRPSFDDLDVVLVADEASVAAVRSASVHVPIVASHAAGIVDAVRSWVDATHLDITIGTPTPADGPRWGDHHFAWSFRRALQRRDVATRIRYRQAWTGPAARRADGVIHLFGLRDRPTSDHQLDVLWIISHPELVTDAVIDNHDLLFVASDPFAGYLRARTGKPVHTLLQATDPERFQPTPGGTPHDLLLVAGYRPDRPIVRELTPTHHDLAIVGHGWTPDVLDPRHLVAEHIPNDQLAAAYSAAAIVLDDHWPDMAEWGFISNRAYDAAACGAFVLSDAVPGMDETFDGGVATYRSGRELRRLVGPYLADPERRRAMAERARAAVLDRHTFDHRVTAMLEVIAPLLAARGAGRGPTAPG